MPLPTAAATDAATPRRPPAPVQRAAGQAGEAASGKRAARVADQIVADVMAMGWPVGGVLGSEADLLGRYGVSRAVFREAVRLVENQQVARTRRGPGGGLVITEPTVSAVTGAVVLYLYRVGASRDELSAAQVVLEAVPAGGPARELFGDVLGLVSAMYAADQQDLGAEVLAEPATGKRAEAVARQITGRIVASGLRPGELVGTERDLIDQAGTGRAVLREAVRLLEYHRIARMRRGPGGGLFVLEPDVVAVTEAVAIYLARRGMRRSDLAGLRIGVEVALAGLAAGRPGGAPAVSAAVESERAYQGDDEAQVRHALHAAVAGSAGNRALELVALVLIRLSRLHQIERLAPVARDQVRAEVLRAHLAIAAAIAAGDGELARHRMRRHLEALAAVMA
ncbi:MAG: GntR family transcriptional regulator [Streptosporangiaceae bacterium]